MIVFMHSSYILEADSAILRMGSTPMGLKFWWMMVVGYLPLFLYGYCLKNWIDRIKFWQSAMIAVLAICWLGFIANALYSPPSELRLLMILLHFEFGGSLFVAAIFLRWVLDKSRELYGQRRTS